MNTLNANCPLPLLDFDLITMGHGSGGLLTYKLLRSGVFDLFQNKLLDTHHDGAVFNLQGPLAFTTDSFVVTPIFFPGGNIGELAVNGTVNDLAMCGAVPKYLSLSFIIEEGLSMEDFWQILISIKEASERAGVMIITGDTKVVERGKGDKLFINTTGIGQVHRKARIGVKEILPGDRVIVSGPVARHGISIMSVREGLSFESDVLSDTINLNEPVMQLIDSFGSRIHMLRDATRGGLATVLAELSATSALGIRMKEENIPVDPQVAGACELLGLDPLYVANEGVFVAIVDKRIAEACIERLQAITSTKGAAVIGEVVDDHHGKVISESNIGGKRVLGMLPGDQLPRIC